jgi:hypothetical protein
VNFRDDGPGVMGGRPITAAWLNAIAAITGPPPVRSSAAEGRKIGPGPVWIGAVDVEPGLDLGAYCHAHQVGDAGSKCA